MKRPGFYGALRFDILVLFTYYRFDDSCLYRLSETLSERI
jgi:hypothetical protein